MKHLRRSFLQSRHLNYNIDGKCWLNVISLLFVSLIADAQGRDNFPFRIASINIRVPTAKDSINHWKNRKTIMIDFLKKEGFDIMCLQEVSSGQMKYITSSMTEYDCIGDSPTVVKGEEYLPIYYKKSILVCLDSGSFWLSQTPNIFGSKGWEGRHTRRVTWSKFISKLDSCVFYVVNTHLDHVGKVANEKGMEVIKCWMDSIAIDFPVLICGDMNCTSKSPTYFKALNYKFHMYDAYQVAKCRNGVNYSFHAFGKRKKNVRRMSDFFFVTSQFDVNEINIPEEHSINGVYLTDHCPVIITVKIK